MPRTPSRLVLVLALSAAAIALVVVAALSLHWRCAHDSPPMIYMGFLITHGAVPYRDFFEVNFPGTFFVLAAVGRVAGWGDLGFRVFDLLCLAIICASTFLWMRRSGRLAALVAAVAFALWYLAAGPEMSLQREYLALVPLSVVLVLAAGASGSRPLLRLFLSGLLTGAALVIRPHVLLLAATPLVLQWRESSSSAPAGRRGAALLAGLCLAPGGMFLYLLLSGGLGPFLDIAVHYWPLHTHLTGQHRPIGGLARVVYLAWSLRDGLMTFYLPAALLGLVVLRGDPARRSGAWLVGGLLLAAAVYPAVSGQFWSYHWLPFHYAALCAAALAAGAATAGERGAGRGVAVTMVVLLLLALASLAVEQARRSRGGAGPNSRPRLAVADSIGTFLCSRLEPGDTVQPLDWTGGSHHGMLLARARLATRFMYDYEFYFAVEDPYVVGLRREFVSALTAARPRFVVEVFEDKPWPEGPGTTREFPELRVFLAENYVTVRETSAFRILERR